MTKRSPSRLRFCGLLVLPLLVAGGCNILGAVAAKTVGNPDIPAKYTLEKKPTLVWVENFQNPDLAESDAELLARTLEDKLKKKDLVPIVGMEKVIDQKNLRPKEFRSTSIAGLGRMVGAEQVIYVDLQQSGIVPVAIGGSYQGRAIAQVKVIRSVDGAVLWPTDAQAGFPVNTETSSLTGSESTSANDIRISLYDFLSDDIVRLFIKYDPDSVPARK
jgi:hypothetical protein